MKQKESRNRYDWIENIHLELSKKLKFYHTEKDICTNQNLMKKLRRIKLYGIVRNK